MKKSAMVLLLGTLAAAGTASAHARWKLDGKLKPRSDDAGLKEPAPCGGAKVDESRRATLTAGSTIEVAFEETVQHKGHYSIAFSKDGTTGFADNMIEANIADDQDDNDTPHDFTYTLKVPEETCDKCAFQLIQFMEGAGNYYSCADVKIVAAGTNTGEEAAEKPAAPKKLKVTVKKLGDL